MKSIISISDKLRYDEKPQLEIAAGVIIEVNNDAMDLLEASELAEKGEIRSAMKLLYSEEDIAKIAALKPTIAGLMTVMTESITAAMNTGKN